MKVHPYQSQFQKTREQELFSKLNAMQPDVRNNYQFSFARKLLSGLGSGKTRSRRVNDPQKKKQRIESGFVSALS